MLVGVFFPPSFSSSTHIFCPFILPLEPPSNVLPLLFYPFYLIHMFQLLIFIVSFLLVVSNLLPSNHVLGELDFWRGIFHYGFYFILSVSPFYPCFPSSHLDIASLILRLEELRYKVDFIPLFFIVDFKFILFFFFFFYRLNVVLTIKIIVLFLFL